MPPVILKWFSRIWKSSGGWGILPDSNFDHMGMLSRVTSKAPVEMSCVSTALHTKKIMRQP